jgi:glucose-6-phosphate isomerase
MWNLLMGSNEQHAIPYYDANIVERIWTKDATLWSTEQSRVDIIRGRLGWLESPHWLRNHVDDLRQRVNRIQDLKWKRVVLIGMGGSSLAPAVLARISANRSMASKYPRFEILDSTHPDMVRKMTEKENLDDTLFLVSSKSGTTLEVTALLSYVASLLSRNVTPGGNGQHFVAITDSGTPLEVLAKEKGFLDCFVNPPDVGGRFSALTYYGMVPAEMLGFDLDQILASAERQALVCQTRNPRKNKVFNFGWNIGSQAINGRNKLTLILSSEIEPIGVWIEQLLAESTGKDGRSIFPIIDEPIFRPDYYAKDRVFSAILSPSDRVLETHCRKLELAEFPVFSSILESEDAHEIGGEFFRWEFATAVAGVVLGIDPFDQPDVQRSKDATVMFLGGERILEKDVLTPCICDGGLTLIGNPAQFKSMTYMPEGLSQLFRTHSHGDYVSILSWLEESETIRELLDTIRVYIRTSLRLPVTLEFGPRYLHSTGQLHKGDSNAGIFIQVVAEAKDNLSIPDYKYSFIDLHRAQADADLTVLSDLGRRVARINLGHDVTKGLMDLAGAFSCALSR